MSVPILVDTDVMVDYLRRYGKAVSFVDEHAERIIISSITVAELYAGAKGQAEEAALDVLATSFPVVPVSADLARAGGLLKRDYGKSHGLGLPDAIIAATAQAENAELCTLNVKHFPMFPDLKPAYTK